MPFLGNFSRAALVAKSSPQPTIKKPKEQTRSLGDAKSWRDLSVWMGIDPGQYPTGGEVNRLGIGKYPGKLFVQGAAACCYSAKSRRLR